MNNEPMIPHDALLVFTVAVRLWQAEPTASKWSDVGKAIEIVKQFERGRFNPTLHNRLESMIVEYRSQGFLQRV